MQDIARGMLGQGFYSNIIGGGDVPAFPSQAEKILYNACCCSALAVAAALTPG
jgi:hypothetical protein